MASAATGNTDVVVIGGGPAGSTVSTLLAQHGCRVQLYERERFPRFHIGESLIPETYWVFQRLKMLDKMKASPFVKKYSVQFVNAAGQAVGPLLFPGQQAARVLADLAGHPQRVRHDDAATTPAEQGVEVHQAAPRAGGALRGRPGRRRAHPEGGRHAGRGARQGGRRCQRPEHDAAKSLQAAAVGSGAEQGRHLDLLGRAPTATRGRDEGATLVIQTTNKQGWWWYIPQHDNTISVGVVGAVRLSVQGPRQPRAVYNEEVEACPAVKERLSPGQRATGYFATKDYSYRSKEVAGDGWVLIGDAFGFLDPLYSSGVLLALKSGEMAADAIAEGLARGDVSAAQLGKWGPTFNKGVDRMRRLVCEYYDGFSFGKFVRTFPHLKGTVTDLLIGDLFTDRVDEVWGPMESLYPPDKKPIPSWTEEAPPEVAANKVNELFLPDGPVR